MKIEMEKREKVHHHLANVLVAPENHPTHAAAHTAAHRTRETRARTTAALMARTRESERARKRERATEHHPQRTRTAHTGFVTERWRVGAENMVSAL